MNILNLLKGLKEKYSIRHLTFEFMLFLKGVSAVMELALGFF